MTLFSNAKEVSGYAERTAKLVPGLVDMQRMSGLMLAERTPETGRVLVVGAGGGLELKVFAAAHPGWRFDGVDPSGEMLDVARTTLGPLGAHVNLIQGYVEAAPTGPFDAAACLLTMHFITIAERRRTLLEIRRRLKPGAPLVVMHLSFAQGGAGRSLWLSRYAAFASSSGVDPERAKTAAAAMDERLTILPPEQDEDLLQEAGFSDINVYYVGLAFRGWVAYAQ